MIEQILGGAGALVWTVAAFVVALSIIVAIHEYGHYIVGRLTGIGAETFSVGFGKVLFSRTDRRGTTWQIAALPFGGYVKFKGDANAASVGKADGPADPGVAGDSIHAAPLWARAATVAAGPLFNFATALIVFFAIALADGRVMQPLTVGDPAAAAGALREGDVVRAVGGIDIADAGDLRAAIPDLPRAGVPWTVERDGRTLEVAGPHPFPPVVGRVQPLSAAAETDLAEGDVIRAVDGMPVATFDDLRDLIGGSDGRTLELTVDRDGRTLAVVLTPKRTDILQPGGGFETRWLAGITGELAFEPAREGVGVGDGLRAAFAEVWFLMRTSITGLVSIVAGDISSCNLSGPIGIAEASGAMAEEGARDFIRFIAVISVAIGLVNLFPIPVLDGGHLVFHAYEAVRGRPPSDGALRVLMAGGLAVVLSLMVFALTNDIFCP